MKWVDIHTHRKPENKAVLSIQNFIFGIDDFSPSTCFSVGIHPWYLDYLPDKFGELLTKIQSNKEFLALGECGMDFRKEYLKFFSKQQQEDIFIRQIFWAEKLQKPLIIHCVKCFDRLIRLKKDYPVSIPWIVHGFSKNKVVARQLIESGFYLSFGRNLLTHEKNQQAFQKIPLDRVFFETDEQSLYQIEDIYQKAAGLKNMDLWLLKTEIWNNFERIFIKKSY